MSLPMWLPCCIPNSYIVSLCFHKLAPEVLLLMVMLQAFLSNIWSNEKSTLKISTKFGQLFKIILKLFFSHLIFFFFLYLQVEVSVSERDIQKWTGGDLVWSFQLFSRPVDWNYIYQFLLLRAIHLEQLPTKVELLGMVYVSGVLFAGIILRVDYK